jgi:carbon monoxide dehydrogenase subunit G
MEILLTKTPAELWDVVRDVGQVHTRFAPGFVVDVALEDGARMVTFGNGMVAREVIVAVDEARQRLAYSVRREGLDHHNASFHVLPEGDGARLTWTADVLPDAAAVRVREMMTAGLAAVGRALGARQTEPA